MAPPLSLATRSTLSKRRFWQNASSMAARAPKEMSRVSPVGPSPVRRQIDGDAPAQAGDASDGVAPETAVGEHAVHEQGDRTFPALGVRDLAELGAYALFSSVMGRTFALNSATFTDCLSV
jgi:hypothetical protein